ncbi:MAG: hypothetical protein ISR99_01400 [Parcubacteria group bacterium]|nr:hypothetical protein [Parcubacteria group bacterium]
MKQKFYRIAKEYETLMEKSSYVFFSGLGIFSLVLVYIINYYAGRFATLNAGLPVKDFLLEIIPLSQWAAIVHLGVSNILIFTVLGLLWFFPRHMPFALLTLALLILTRAAFINMTYLGIYPDASPIIGSLTTFGGDLFFSGHVAIPFLFALIFWKKEKLRYFFIAVSIFLGASTLFSHVHYSIDVFAAPFIAYGVYTVATYIFHHSFAFMK